MAATLPSAGASSWANAVSGLGPERERTVKHRSRPFLALVGSIAVVLLLLGSEFVGGVAGRSVAPSVAVEGHPGGAGPVRGEGGGPGPILTLAGALSTGTNSPGPPTFDPQNGYVYVPNFLARSVTVVDGLSIAGSVSVAGNPIATLFDPVNGLVYVTESNSTSLAVLEGTSLFGTVTTSVCLSARFFETPAFDPANGYVYVPDPCSGNVTVVHNTSVVATLQLPGSTSSTSAVYDANDEYVYLSDPTQGRLYVVNNTSFLTTVTVLAGPVAPTYDPSSGLLYVVDSGVGNLSVVRGTAVVANVPFGGDGWPGGLAYSATYDDANQLLYVPYQGFQASSAEVAVFNGTTEVTTIGVGPLIAGASTYVPYANGTGYVYEMSGESLNGGLGTGTATAIGGTLVAGTLNFSSEPSGAVYDPENGYVYVPTYTPENVTTGQVSSYVVVITCSGCAEVTLSERGVPAGTPWGVTVGNRSSRYAEAATATAPAGITLRLVSGLYSLRIEGPMGTTVAVTSANANYSATLGTLRVSGVTGPAPAGNGGGARPAEWEIALTAVAALGVAIATVAVSHRARSRREGEALVREMRGAIERGLDDWEPPK